MSLMNSYMFGSQRTQNPLDILQQRSRQGAGDGVSNVQLDLSHLVSSQNGGPTNSANTTMMHSSSANTNNLQHQLQLQHAISQQQHISSGMMPQQHQQMQTKTKKAKETLLKTPLSLLNEICSKAKATPVFTIDENGPVHSRIYSCTVKVDTLGYACEATATGKTKKDAKQDAAKALLIQMDADVEKYLIPKVAKEESVIEVDPEVPGNPVGDLNDLCTKLKRLPPEYEDVAEFGKPHERVYTVVCKLGSHIEESGRGRSKKNAKKVAAHRVHKRVVELIAKGSEGTAMLKDEDNLIEKLNSLALVSKQEAKKMVDGWKLNDWMAELRSRSGPKLDQFKDPSQPRITPGDPIKILKEIAEEQKFKLEFTELQYPGSNDIKTCLIAVSAGSQPITVLMGSADSKTQAKKVAAESFIEMLRLILRSE